MTNPDRARAQADIAARYQYEHGLDLEDYDNWPDDLAEAYAAEMLAT